MKAEIAWWTGAGVALALVVLAGTMEWRRNRLRVRSFDSVGWVPWRGIQAAAFFAALACAVFAMHA